MNEAQVNEPQADDGVDEETLASSSGDVDAEKLRRLRLTGFLRELVREEGRVEAAELLGVAYRTVVRAEESGEITGRMGDALERLLGTGDDPEVARLWERVDALEGGVEALAKELRDGLGEIRAAVAGNAESQGQGQAQDGKPDAGAGRSETRAAPPVAGLRPKKPFTERRLDPQVVTEEAADDDEAAFGPAWPLIVEWRGLKDSHPNQGKGLSWLVAEERLMEVEVALLEDHGLTLPPEKQPLRGFGRKGQTTHRWEALADTRVALRKRKLLRWVRRSSPCGCGGSRPRSRLRGRFSAVATSERSGR